MWKLGVAVVLLGAAAVYVSSCPCERVPGLWLLGERIDAPVEDWSFANEVPLCQIEVRSWRPHSVNLNCMSTGPALYISCSRCEGKSWSSTVLQQPLGLIRMFDKVYPVRFERVLDRQELDMVWRVRAEKLNREGARPDHWWSFRLTSVPG